MLSKATVRSWASEFEQLPDLVGLLKLASYAA